MVLCGGPRLTAGIFPPYPSKAACSGILSLPSAAGIAGRVPHPPGIYMGSGDSIETLVSALVWQASV